MGKSVKSLAWEAESLMGTRPPSCWQRFCPRAALSHVGLIIALMLYTVGGGFVFRALEYPAEIAKQEYHRERLLEERYNLIRFVADFNSNATGYDSLEEMLSDHLAVYEKVLEAASSSGLALEIERQFPAAEEKWSILQAVFFSSTVLTTIGVYADGMET